MFFTYYDDLGSTPARVNRFTGEVQISLKHFDKMPEFSQKFIVEHEKGHFLNDTRSEFKADAYAFKHLVGTAPRSLKSSVKSISGVLSFRNPEHIDRLAELVRMALDYDYNTNGNAKAKEGLDLINELIANKQSSLYTMENLNSRSYFDPHYSMSGFDDLYDNARGKARRQARKATRVANRQTRVANRQAKKTTRVAARKQRKTTFFPARGKRRTPPPSSYMDNQPILAQEDLQYNEPSYSVAEPVESYPVEQYNEPVEQYNVTSYQDTEPVEEEPETIEEMDSYFGDDGTCLDESYYDNAGGGKARREARRAKRQEQKEKKRDLKNDKIAAKNEIKLARADAKRTKADAKKSLADQGKSGTDWIGGAVDGVLGLFGKKKESAEVSGDPSDMANDNSAGDGKLLGMPKGVAIAVIVILVMAIIATIITFLIKRSKKA